MNWHIRILALVWAPQVAMACHCAVSGLLVRRLLTAMPFFDLPQDEKEHLEGAKNQRELELIVSWIVDRGTRVRFQGRTIYRQVHDADDNAKRDDSKAENKVGSKADEDVKE